MAFSQEFGSGFIYDAKQKKAILSGKTEDGIEVEIQLIRRNEDDSHDAVLQVGKEKESRFVLRGDDVEYPAGRIQLKNPPLRILVDSTTAAKFRGFTKGNIPTPDIPADSLP